GLDIFSTPLRILYTRRMGRVPPSPALPETETALETPGPSAIPGAVKLVGRLTDKLSVGALSALTSANEIPVTIAGGTTAVRLADPTTLFNVLRLKRAAGGNGHAGLVLAATNRFERPSVYGETPEGISICPGAKSPKGEGRCFRDAYVGAIDGRWRSSSGDYSVSG